MYRMLVARITRRSILTLVSGRGTWPLRLLADDVRFRFPGASSWAASTASSGDMARWIRDFAALRPSYEVLDVVVTGPPWNTRIAVRLRDGVGDDYVNEGMQYIRMRWGKLTFEQVYLDTEAVTVSEEHHPERRRPTPAGGGTGSSR